MNVLGKNGRLILILDKDDAGKKAEKGIVKRLIDKVDLKIEQI